MPEELKRHLNAVRRWIKENAQIAEPEPGLTSEERKQLQAINKTIQQLSVLNVSIPDDLRRLKLELSAKEDVKPATTEIDNKLADVESLMEQLQELIKETSALRKRLAARSSNKTRANKNKQRKHFRVSLEELLQSGYLTTEDKLELKYKKTPYLAKILENGRISAKTATGWQEFENLSTAATSISGRAMNGWREWRKINRNGTRTTLQDIRTKFMKDSQKQREAE